MIDSGRQSLSDGQYGHKRREIRKEISTLSIFFFGGGYNVNFVSYVHVCIGACQCLQIFHQIFITLLTFRWPKQSSDEHFRKTSGYFFLTIQFCFQNSWLSWVLLVVRWSQEQKITLLYMLKFYRFLCSKLQKIIMAFLKFVERNHFVITCVWCCICKSVSTSHEYSL